MQIAKQAPKRAPPKRKKDVLKMTLFQNNCQYSFSVHSDGPRVKEFSFGYVLKEVLSNNRPEGKQAQLKTSNPAIGSMSIYHQFKNKLKLDLTELGEGNKRKKVTLYKNMKLGFYGVTHTSSSKLTIRLAKVSEIFLLLMNIHQQIVDNEADIKKSPYRNLLVENRARLKQEFINTIINMTKRYF